MRTWKSLTTRRLVLVGSVLALAAAVLVTGVAIATPGSSLASSALLADGTFVNTINVNSDPIKFRTKDQVEVLQVSQTANPGFTSGWHAHTGVVLVNVTAGSLTFHAADCTVTTVSAGQGYLESPGEPILARNEGGITAAWVTTQIIPVGAARRVDVDPGLCGEL